VEKIQLEILGLSSSQSQSGSFALVLGETDGNRRLPIIIGMFEAQAIAIEIEKIIPNRPMTHDLFKSIAIGLRFSAPIYTYEKIMTDAGIILTDESEDEASDLTAEITKEESKTKTPSPSEDKPLKDHSYDKLKEMLNKALDEEDYERAAKIRDELNRRN
jgi:bifunctional DNase/RNase